jgi:hypothetical protein
VQFHLLSSSADHHYQAGEIIRFTDTESAHLINLPPLIVALDADKNSSDDNGVEVVLATQLTEVGTLQIDCLADNQQRWHVEFEIRQSLSQKRMSPPAISLPAKFAEASDKIALVYHADKKDKDPKAIKTLRNDLEKALGKRDLWDVPVLRTFYDQLLGCHEYAKRSSTHERNWLNLAGYCMRPGYGYPADEWRISQTWPLYEQGLRFEQETQVWIDWWNFWRRLSGGLNIEQQLRLYEDVSRFLDPAALTSRKLQAEAKQKSYEDMVKLVATLEQLPIANKTQLVDWFLQRLEKSSETITSWWAVGRIAARVPFHGSAHNVVPKEDVGRWLPKLLKIDWKKNQQAAFAAVLMTRMSGDRTRDAEDSDRQLVVQKLAAAKAPASWIEMIETVKELDEAETRRVFGEGLPVGLTLIQ